MPKLRLPKLGLPKFGLPKLGMPKLRLPLKLFVLQKELLKFPVEIVGTVLPKEWFNTVLGKF